ncbi:hypothetical protein FOL47_010091 [Perkinsus chesapeaki]|uniref:Uncharacterized protein n=1 Tax=Perkinsus chesapeaki TaxID=330153 RepID=A0A7J6L4V9_PERCH|nr:hypothetical protein FOL47_010091 [Perkinsus chesapeaki]
MRASAWFPVKRVLKVELKTQVFWRQMSKAMDQTNHQLREASFGIILMRLHSAPLHSTPASGGEFSSSGFVGIRKAPSSASLAASSDTGSRNAMSTLSVELDKVPAAAAAAFARTTLPAANPIPQTIKEFRREVDESQLPALRTTRRAFVRTAVFH